MSQSQTPTKRAARRRDQLRVLVHDYGGYSFIVQLSRELARRGHRVLHLYAAGVSLAEGPDGAPGR